MRKERTTLVLLSLAVAVLSLGAGARAADRWPSSELLLPCHEVLLDADRAADVSLTTYFDVVNSSDEALDVSLTVLSNWGIEVLRTEITLEPNELSSFNLAKWIVDGKLPDRTLDAEEIEHVQAALCGEISPMDSRFYSTGVDAVEPRRAVGSVVVKAVGEEVGEEPDALWGGFFIVDSLGRLAQGEVLANLDPAVKTGGSDDDDDLCDIHAFRFIEGGAFDGGTEFMVWNASSGDPSETAEYTGTKIPVRLTDFNQSGEIVEQLDLELEPLQMYSVAEFGLPNEFGWLKVDSLGVGTFVAVRYSAADAFSAMTETFCLERKGRPCFDLAKSTNGEDADHMPGPRIPIGGHVQWTYVLTNNCDDPLFGIALADSDPAVDPVCDGDALEPGESMTCRARAHAYCGQYGNLARATATTVVGSEIVAEDRSHYFGTGCSPGVYINKTTNGVDADMPPGPEIALGDGVEWAYVVWNKGGVPLYNIVVTDDQGFQVACPKDTLERGETMTCFARGTALCGLRRNLGMVTCETEEGFVLQDTDPSHYVGVSPDCRAPAE